ncbi:MAG: type pilus assembly protein PilO [Pseudomonadota bacterium]|nr:type pilus assembly protein PilO [Pseudomonadota bacterium]MDQ5881424.1 type pilus assembly protein PilO [Pseudomonadota bacterium]MDQ5905500.1 type pilus assembly protein PilO [Pseudomonadota bacterium]MDQ5906048.1 type pilus assembly protein PilO [Pseudomonadota bacterium]MDQ5918810.1 type pilus assembly protein PilO [Pseudomonadota bacterium]
MKKPALPNVDFQSIIEDFRRLNPNDVGTWPTIPKVVVLVGLFSALIGAGWWFVWQDQLDELETKQKQEITFKEEYLNKKRQAVNLDLHLQQLNEIDRSFGALLKQLPNKSEVESLLVEINQAGMGRGLQFELFKPGQELVKDFYAELPISVRLVGSYHDFGAFAGDIGRLSRIVTLNNLAISTQAKDGALVLDAVTKTFRYLDEEELARQRKAAQDAKKGGQK